ncbi:MAG: hypothetical protein K2J15_00160, partial [Muribaculaceae bacterium]|nr:hypothetical protein [Muribaculaceae bacterium]
SSVNSDKKVELLYSAFNQFRMDKDVVTGISGVTSTRFSLNYDRSTSCLSVVGEGDSRYSLGVFTLDGILVMQADIREGENLSVATIEEGVYIAVALGEEDAQEIKFVR